MGTRYTKKNLGDPNWSKPNNYKIKQNDAIYDVEIVPNKGVKGDISAQPFNDKNAEDIENALVSLDDDLAFIEADYITEAEHELKQNITDNGLNTTNKTIVGAINEVKSEGEYHDLLQDDAIAIVNNKINALPMNGSLKNIRTSLVGIPTTFTNIDMFNTKQTVTNYQPLSLDYKGAAEPHIILMKTIGDYTFDFAIEATHTNGTDTTIILEAWVDGVLYDTATRTLVGGSNQINGITGFFTYSKGTDTVPTEIYFRFRASQGNTSANKALINTNLLGNSSENSFTDTDHVTGTNLNEPTYNGQTTTFIINDIKSSVNNINDTAVLSVDNRFPDPITKNVNSLQTSLNDGDINFLDSDYVGVPVEDIILDIFQKAQTNVGTDKNFNVSFAIDPNTLNINFGQALRGLIQDKYGRSINEYTFNFKLDCKTNNGVTHENNLSSNKVELWSNTADLYFTFDFVYNDFADVIVRDASTSVHQDLYSDVRSDMRVGRFMAIDAPYRDYISGITFIVSDYDSQTSSYNQFDANIRYIPRVMPISKPPYLSGGTGDTIFSFNHSIFGHQDSSLSTIALENLSNMYFEVHYCDVDAPFPEGIYIEGLLDIANIDQVLSGVIIHYGGYDWTNNTNKLQFVDSSSFTPAILNQPMELPEIGDNMEETRILKEVLDNA